MSNSAQRKRDAVQAAMSVASDVTEGLLDPAALEAEVIKECRQLVGKVIGPEDALWGLQVEIARGVLAAGGIPGNELAEWLAVQRQSEPEPESEQLSAEDAEALAACQRLFANDPTQGPIQRESQIEAARAIAGSGLLKLLEKAAFIDSWQAGDDELGDAE